jgi:hypothetical protein
MSEEVKSESEKKKEDWMNAKWRPMMGWMYMVVCMMDMVVFPILWSLLQTFAKVPLTQWNPLTLQGAGLFHIAMGAVLGIAAFGRTQEKLNGANNGGISTPSSGLAASSVSAPSSFNAPVASSGFGAPVSASGFGGSGFGGAPSAPADTGFGQVTTGFGGKPAPIQPPQPLI